MFEILFLLITGTLLIVLNFKAIRKEEKSFSKALREENMNLNDYTLEIGRLKAEFAEHIAELQSEILRLKEAAEEEKGSRFNAVIDDSYDNAEIMDRPADSSLNEIIESPELEAKLEPLENEPNSEAALEDSTQAAVLKFEQALIENEEKGKPNNVRIDKIKKMLDENLSMDEIAERLDMGKGELLLIKELYLK